MLSQTGIFAGLHYGFAVCITPRPEGSAHWPGSRKHEGTKADMSYPQQQGLYDPRNEHDACGVGFVVNIKGEKSHGIIGRGLEILLNIDHRGAVGADPLMGDGAGVLVQIPDRFFREEMARQEPGLDLEDAPIADPVAEDRVRDELVHAALVRRDHPPSCVVLEPYARPAP